MQSTKNIQDWRKDKEQQPGSRTALPQLAHVS